MKEKIVKFFRKTKKNIVEYVITNRLFLSYVILAVFSTMFVRKFTIGSFWGFKPFITDLGIILLIGSFGYLLKPKNQFKYYFIWLILFDAICMISSIYYMFYTSFPSAGELETVGQVQTVGGSIIEKLRFVDLVYLFIPLIFYLIHKKLTKTTYYNFIEKIEKSKRMLLGTLITAFACLAYSFGTATGTDYSRLIKQWNRVYIVERFGIITYQFNDIIQTVSSKIGGMFGADEALENFNNYFDNKEEHQKNKYTGILKGKNIVFVHMESIQSFLLDLEYNGKQVMPNLNKIAKEGMHFTNFYPQISTGTSSDTEFTLLTGLLPAASGPVFISYYDRNYFSLPKYFKNMGYYTFSMHGNHESMWNRAKAHPALGYEGMYYRDCFTYTDDDTINLGIKDEVFFKQGVKMMENIENEHKNYMGTVITLSNHSPFSKASLLSDLDLSTTYQKKDEITGLVTTETSDYLSSTKIGEYLKSANYADKAMGDFIKYINESDKFNDTVFVFYGDHDAKFSQKEINYLFNVNPENGKLYEEGDPNYRDYDYYSHELNKKTPLIIWTKNKKIRNKLHGNVTYNMGMYDISTTILNMYGLYNKYSVGSDIFNVKDKNIIVYPNGNFLTDKIYYNNSTGEYKVLQPNAIIEKDYIDKMTKIVDDKLEMSSSIIIYNLLDKLKINEE